MNDSGFLTPDDDPCDEYIAAIEASLPEYAYDDNEPATPTERVEYAGKQIKVMRGLLKRALGCIPDGETILIDDIEREIG